MTALHMSPMHLDAKNKVEWSLKRKKKRKKKSNDKKKFMTMFLDLKKKKRKKEKELKQLEMPAHSRRHQQGKGSLRHGKWLSICQ